MKKSEIIKNPNAEAEGLELPQAFGISKEQAEENKEKSKQFFKEQIIKTQQTGELNAMELAKAIEETFTQDEINFFIVNTFTQHILGAPKFN